MPVTTRELVETCLRLQIKRILVDGHTWELDQEVIARLERNLIVRVSEALGSIEQIDWQSVVHFKRYLPSLSLSEEQAQVLRLLAHPLSIEELGRQLLARNFSELIGFLRPMEQMRLLRLELSDPAMKAIPDLMSRNTRSSMDSLNLGMRS
jgi:hypothetical protein